MKTETAPGTTAAPPQPGNVSVRQLAASLSKTPAGGSAPANTTGDPATPTKKTDEEPAATTADANTATPEGGEPTDPAAEIGTDPEKGTTQDPEPEPEPEPGDAEPEPEPEPEPQAGLPAELQDAIDLAKGDGKKGVAQLLKRVHSLADQRDTERNARLAAAEENRQLRSELQQARTKAPEVQTSGGASAHPEVAQISQELSNVDHWLAWCDSNPEGGEIPKGDETVTLTPQQVQAVRRDLQNQRTELVARKVQTEREYKQAYGQAYAQHHQEALKEFPWLADAAAPERQEMDAILKVFPAFKQSPDYELAIGDYLAGRKLRDARTKARATNGTVRKPTPARTPTKVVAEPPGGARRGDPKKDEKKQADEKFQSSGRTADLAKTFAASRRASRQ